MVFDSERNWDRFFVGCASRDKEEMADLRTRLPKAFANLKPPLEPIWSEDVVGESLLDNVRQMIEGTRFGIYDLTYDDPSVYIQLGMSRALNKPSLITVQKDATIPNFIESPEVIRYSNFINLEERLGQLAERDNGWWGIWRDRDSHGERCPLKNAICPYHNTKPASRTCLVVLSDSEQEGDQIIGIRESLGGELSNLGISLTKLAENGNCEFSLCTYYQQVRKASFVIYNLDRRGQKDTTHKKVYFLLGVSLGHHWQPCWAVIHERGFDRPPLLQGIIPFEYPERQAISTMRSYLWKRIKDLFEECIKPPNPFRGLRAFKGEDASVFSSLGRNKEVNTVVDMLNDPSIQTVIVHGEPGVGKTSLILAGVLPSLEERQSELVPVTFRVNELDPKFLDRQIRKQIRDKLVEVLPGAKGDFLRLVQSLQNTGKNLLIVFDQFEQLYQQEEKIWRKVLGELASVMSTTRLKFLIGMREEYSYRFDEDVDVNGRKYFPNRNARDTLKIHRLGIAEAEKVITELAKGYFSKEAAKRLVEIFCGEDERPYTPYIQIVCHELWQDLIAGQTRGQVTEHDCDEEHVRIIINKFLDNKIGMLAPELQGLARRILRNIVRRDGGKIVQNPADVPTIAQNIGAETENVRHIVQELRDLGLVEFKRSSNPNWPVQVVHDFLAKVIVEKYSEQLDDAREAADNLIQSLAISVMTAANEGGDQEALVLNLVRRFLEQQYPIYFDKLEVADRLRFLDVLALPIWRLEGLLRGARVESQQVQQVSSQLDGQGDVQYNAQVTSEKANLSGACLIVDCLYQLLLIFEAYDRAEKLGQEFANLIQRKLPEQKKLYDAYLANHAQLWQSVFQGDELSKETSDFRTMQILLRLAQQKREYTITDLKPDLKLDTRLSLWRVLYKLWQDRGTLKPRLTEVEMPSTEHRPPLDLFSYRWILAPSRPYLKKYNALEDHRAYYGVMIHIPAGEHAMRNQRAARKLLIRTVAVERGSRSTAPGWHEADDKELITEYSDEEFSKLLNNLADNYAVMLNTSDRKLWVVLEAQEYPIKKMVDICRQVDAALKTRDRSVVGSIIADIGASIANRKDLTRGLATLAGVPQPPYRVIALKPEEEWQHIWQVGMEREDVIHWLPQDWEAKSSEEKKKIWQDTLAKAVEAVGSRAMVKPVTTEFLKGATPVEASTDLVLAWERAQKQVGFPNMLVEKLISNVRKELLVIVVRRPGTNGDYVRVPPIWYQCVRDLEWRRDAKHQSVPIAMDYAWVDPNPDAADQGIFESAQEHSRRMAEQLWGEVESKMAKPSQNEDELSRYLVNNHFLEFEWLVLDDGELMLNEIKPTQLDKGIISNTAFTHSDSELLVRNLFGLSLPDKVQLIRPQEIVICGAVLTQSEFDTDMIVQGRQLISYDGIDGALKQGADVFLYSDKMRSRPYIGRRMGILTLSADSLERAVELLQAARAELKPQYETPE